MQIAKVLYPVTSLGPGKRLAIWTRGCSKKCPHCISREWWDFVPGQDISPERISNIIHNGLKGDEVDGITLSGGDPMEQADDCLKLLYLLSDISTDVILYTGYTERELNKILTEEQQRELRSCVSLLIDGRYVDELNDNNSALRGSTNQSFIFFDETKRQQYLDYIAKGRMIQSVHSDKGISLIGILNKE